MNLVRVRRRQNKPDLTIIALRETHSRGGGPSLQLSPADVDQWHNLGTSHHILGELLESRGEGDESLRSQSRGLEHSNA